MKLVLIGGGGVRAPEFTRGVLAFAADLDLQELWLMDITAERLALISPLCEKISQSAGMTFHLHTTTQLDEALRDADFIVTSIRVGFEQGRVLDERIALRHNVLGQETTGAGGFAMAMRSIPALLEIAERAAVLTPRAWLFNFTNPAGLVTQALRDTGFPRVVGICDSANTAQQAIAHWLNCRPDSVKTEVFGLNHLSWTRRALVNGRDVLPELLANPDFIQHTHLRFFGAEFIQRLRLFPNEYLFYFYLRDVALARILAEKQTRGEEIQQLSEQLFAQLRACPPEQRWREYEAYAQRRHATYMAYAENAATQSTVGTRYIASAPTSNPEIPATAQPDETGGYAGVALNTALALAQDRPLRIGLNVPNNGAINGLSPTDVVEVTCLVDGQGIHPISIGDIPEDPYLLVRAVKRYEQLAVQAIIHRNRALAVDALAAHPLIGSYHLARLLINDYIEAHRPYIADWS